MYICTSFYLDTMYGKYCLSLINLIFPVISVLVIVNNGLMEITKEGCVYHGCSYKDCR